MLATWYHLRPYVFGSRIHVTWLICRHSDTLSLTHTAGPRAAAFAARQASSHSHHGRPSPGRSGPSVTPGRPSATT